MLFSMEVTYLYQIFKGILSHFLILKISSQRIESDFSGVFYNSYRLFFDLGPFGYKLNLNDLKIFLVQQFEHRFDLNRI